MPVACTPLSSRLKAAASPERRAALREIVRSMNLSYSNRIEGQGTHSANIERALPPVWKSVPRFLGRMDDVYGRLKGMDAVVYTISRQPTTAWRGRTLSRTAMDVPCGCRPIAGCWRSAVSRGDFARMTGLEERTARKVISRFLKDGLLKSDGHRSDLRIGFPLASLSILLPNLYPEASTAVQD
jgi:hypothetical protein